MTPTRTIQAPRTIRRRRKLITRILKQKKKNYKKKTKNYKKKNKKEFFGKRGFVQESDIYGTITDPNVIWLAHGDHIADETAKLGVAAIFRHGYEKASGDYIEGITGLYKRQCTITLNVENTSGTETVITQVLAINTTIQSSITFNVANPVAVRLIQTSVKEASFTHLRSIKFESTASAYTMDFTSMRMHYFSEVQMKMQNQSAVGTDNEADDVNAIPIQGTHIEFSSPFVFTKNSVKELPPGPGGSGSISAMQQNIGMLTCRGNRLQDDKLGLGGQASITENVPNVGYFTRVKSSNNIKILPGQLITRKSYLNGSLPVEKFFEKVRSGETPPGLTVNSTGLGKCNLYMFEKTMRSTVANASVKVAFEKQTLCGFYITYNPKRPTLFDYISVTADDPLPAP
jgi:hypothetical protein